MEYLWLYLSMLITWILITIAEAAQLAIRAVKSGKKFRWSIYIARYIDNANFIYRHCMAGEYEVGTNWILNRWLFAFTHRHTGFGLYCLFYYLYKT